MKSMVAAQLCCCSKSFFMRPGRRIVALSILAALAAGPLGRVSPAWGQAFPAQGIDTFPSQAPLGVDIGTCSVSLTPCLAPADCPLGAAFEACPLTRYATLSGLDLTTVASRSDVIGEGTAGDTGGAAVLTTGCAACDGTVADSDLTCWPPPPPGWEGSAGSREIHTEMLSLRLCGPCTNGACAEICYLAGQPAFDALNAVGQAGAYLNSYGEVERLNPGTTPPDFPVASFWDVKGVVRITPPPIGTSGVFVLTDPTNSVLMVAGGLGGLPPQGVGYQPQAGTRLPGGGGGACGVLPIAIRDPVNNAPGKSAGQIIAGVQHNVGTSIPALPPWALVALVAILLAVGLFVLSRSRKRRSEMP